MCAGTGHAIIHGRANAVAGRGLEGDRYFLEKGTFSEQEGTGRDLTLIEAEALEGLAADAALRGLVDRG